MITSSWRVSTRIKHRLILFYFPFSVPSFSPLHLNLFKGLTSIWSFYFSWTNLEQFYFSEDISFYLHIKFITVDLLLAFARCFLFYLCLCPISQTLLLCVFSLAFWLVLPEVCLSYLSFLKNNFCFYWSTSLLLSMLFIFCPYLYFCLILSLSLHCFLLLF